jgi:hypothetical protein
MKEKLEKFLDTDFFYVNKGLEDEDDPKRRNDICWYARQRALGACEFANSLGLDFAEASAVFYKHCDRLEEAEYGKMC